MRWQDEALRALTKSAINLAVLAYFKIFIFISALRVISLNSALIMFEGQYFLRREVELYLL